MRRSLILLLSSVGIGVLSAAVASPALLGLAIGLVLLAAAAWALLALSTRSVAVERIVGAVEVQEDAPLRLSFTVARRTWLPVQVEIANHSGGWLAVKDDVASLELRVGRPGTWRLAPTITRLRDPLGLFERRSLAGRVERLLVLPAPSSRTRIQRGHLRLTDDLEPHGLAPYAPGIPLTRIHWPSLARGAGVHVRHLAAPPGGLPLVAIETDGAPDRDALDWTARTAAGYILSLARLCGCHVLLPGDANPTRVINSDAAWRTVHRRLATLGDLPPPGKPVPPRGTAAVRVRAAAAPATTVQPPPLPEGVSAAATCAPGR